MSPDNNDPDESGELRRRAEEMARAGFIPIPDDLERMSREKIRDMLHELHVHQIELQMQNEELRRIQAALESSHSRYFELYEFAPIGYLTLGEAGLIDDANAIICRWLNVPRNLLLHRPLSRFITAEDQDAHYLNFKKLLETGEPQTYELQLIKQGGSLFWVQLEMIAYSDKARGLEYRVAVSDINTRKRSEEARRKLDERMNQVQKLEALGFLAAGVSHNLKNVLAAVLGVASAREFTTTDAKDLEAFRVICKACEQGRGVLDSLLRFAHPRITAMAPLDLSALLSELHRVLYHTTRMRITIEERLSPEPVWIMGDAGSISQALMNLCVNSLSAMSDGGSLTLRTMVADADWAGVEVEDTGEGMSPEVLAHALEPFYTTRPMGEGTGLGLSMAYGAIKAHNGTLEISSQLGRGTLVKIRFPRIPAPVPEAPAPARPQAFKSLRVLVVDDDELVRLSTVGLLETGGCRATAVVGGPEALACLDAGTLPDVVLLDLNMPGMDGMETLKRIRSKYFGLPVIIVSGQPGIQAWECFRQPNLGVLPKPFSREELMNKLAEMALRG